MVSPSGARRILVPADRRPTRERFETLPPFFLAQPAAAADRQRPQLLSFASDVFLEDFLAIAAGTRAAPALLPWRDWAEPPAALVDTRGLARYPVSALARRMPHAQEIEAASGPAMDGDGIPHGLRAGEATTTPAWLRKLYLPLHERFNLIAFDLHCAAAGWPRVAPQRIRASGAVLRRLVADPAHERWEDWIATDERHGAWIELLPARLHATELDPQHLPEPDAAGAARLRTVFGLGAADALPVLALASQPLSPLPAETAAGHCSLYGYLPVFSAAQQQPIAVLGGSDSAQVAAALAARARARLDAAFAGIASLQETLRPRLRALLAATVLPTRPDVGEAENADDFAVTLSSSAPAGLGQVGDVLAQAIDLALREALARLWRQVTGAVTASEDIAGNVRSAAELWSLSGAAGAATAADLFASLPDPTPGFPGNETALWLGASSASPHWGVLLRQRLHQLMDAWLDNTPLPAPALGASNLIPADLLAVVVLMGASRLRGCRLALAAGVNQAVSGDRREAELLAKSADGRFELGPTGLAEYIDAVLDAEPGRDRVDTTPPWPPVALPAQWVRDVHAWGREIEHACTRYEDELAGAGNGLVDERALRVESVATALDSALGALPGGLGLADAGLRMDEQPLCGLLVLPGLRATAAGLAPLRDAVAARYVAQPERLALPEARAAGDQPRLRYDADHLYAAWGWVRIAGHTPCEPDRIVWTRRSEPFSIADPSDLLGQRPASIRMPDIAGLLRDIPRLARARAKPFAGVAAAAGSGTRTGAEMADTKRDFGLGMICNFGIPVLTICALVLFKIIFSILIALPSFSWMLLLKFCLPFTRRGP